MTDEAFVLSKNINPHFYKVWNTRKSEIILKGGRGSFKSSVVAFKLCTMMYRQITAGHRANVVCVRENKTNLRTSVYRQVREALEMMGLIDEFKFFVSPMEIVHTQTDSSFVFYGADDPNKLKSDKTPDVIGLWYEEAANMKSAEVFDQANPTFIRNKSPYVDEVKIFYSYNPPKNPYDWINEWVEKKKMEPDCLVDHSTYLDDDLGFTVPQQLRMIETYKENDYDYYRYLYLGEAVGLGTSVYNMNLFQSVQNVGELPDGDHIVMLRFSADVGHSVSATTVGCYGITYKRRLVLLDTYYYSPDGKVHKLAPSELAPQIHDFVQEMQHKYPWPTDMLIMDSAEQALRNEYNRRYNVDWWNVRKLKKVDMIDRVQNVLAQGKLFYLPTENNLKYFISEHQKYQWDEKTLQSDKPEVVKVDDHTCDQLQYLVRSSEDELGINW
ncbi:PBSX family phage terminase large subunit [Weissella viridescens]